MIDWKVQRSFEYGLTVSRVSEPLASSAPWRVYVNAHPQN